MERLNSGLPPERTALSIQGVPAGWKAQLPRGGMVMGTAKFEPANLLLLPVPTHLMCKTTRRTAARLCQIRRHATENEL